MGERFASGFKHGSMSVELYVPQGRDPQKPHDQDELYFIIEGTSILWVEGSEFQCAPGDAFLLRPEKSIISLSSLMISKLGSYFGPQGWGSQSFMN